MNMIRRRKRQRFGTRENEGAIRCPGHLKWVRGHECLAAGRDAAFCGGKIQAHHLQSYRAIEGGMGLKVGDDKTVPLCAQHHVGIHIMGQEEFERRYTPKIEASAAELWKASPHRIRFERAQQGKD